jgi:hypothetical protein
MQTEELSPIEGLKPLWLLLTSGAFISLAGGLLTLLYFWRIGGVPIGQAAATGSMATLVLLTAVFLALLFLMVWMIPTVTSFMFTDDDSFAKQLRVLFGRAERPAPQVVAEEPGPPTSPEHQQDSPDWKRLFGFSLSTVGVGGLAIVLFLTTTDSRATAGWASYAGRACLVLWGAAVAAALVMVWFKAPRPAPVQGRSKLGWPFFSYLAIGYLSSAFSAAPLLTLSVMALRATGPTDSIGPVALGVFAASVGLVIAYALSLWALLDRTKSTRVRWTFVTLVNAGILLFVVAGVGLSSRMLDAVMVLASVRVENAVITLEPEGCELLEAMGAAGWGAAAGDNNLCVLAGVTIQSTLEPAMQIACWREDSHSEKLKGAFSIPLKHVRSVWKAEQVAASTAGAVCPPRAAFKDVGAAAIPDATIEEAVTPVALMRPVARPGLRLVSSGSSAQSRMSLPQAEDLAAIEARLIGRAKFF